LFGNLFVTLSYLCPLLPVGVFAVSQPYLQVPLSICSLPRSLCFSPQELDPGYLPLYLFLARSLFLGAASQDC
jgi:hypothetical protein